MSESNKPATSPSALNKNIYIRSLQTFGDWLSDLVTKWAGSTPFLVLNIVWFVFWILINVGAFGRHLIFDAYPFGLLTMIVSLEAIVLSIFVLISQNRQSERSEIRSELDYLTDLKADAEIRTIIAVMERLAAKQEVDVSDLLHQLDTNRRRILREHPLTKDTAAE